jgi:anti-sigma factor RsiW
MRCKKVMERLDDHVDGILPPTESSEIRDHLDRCDECRETSLALKAASTSLATWNDVELPSDCFDKILARIDALPPDALQRTAPRGLFSRLLRIESVRAARVRWMATSGLAAAAAVLASVLISRVETHPVRRLRQAPEAQYVGTPASWFKGYDFDNGLLYRGARVPSLRAIGAGSGAGFVEAR